MKDDKAFEVRFNDTFNYLFSYGFQSRFFHELNNNRRFVASRCPRCNFVWFPPREMCSKCFGATDIVVLFGGAELVSALVLPEPPRTLRNIKSPVSVALVKMDQTDTLFKTLVVAPGGAPPKGTRLIPRLHKNIQTLADLYFVPA